MTTRPLRSLPLLPLTWLTGLFTGLPRLMSWSRLLLPTPLRWWWERRTSPPTGRHHLAGPTHWRTRMPTWTFLASWMSVLAALCLGLWAIFAL